MMTPETALNSQGMFKNSSPNKKLTIYLESRDYVVDNGSADKIQGVIHVESAELKNMKLLGQVTMIFRYGRDDKEVMGVESCNETIVSLTQIWPPYYHVKQPISAFQETLIKRLGDYAFPFYLNITHLAPPSIKLVPAKQYYGAPMGTSYDVRAYMEDSSRSNTVRMGIRLFRGRRRPQPRLFPPHAPHPTLNALVWLPHQPFRYSRRSPELASNEVPHHVSP
ncbi:arrestin homolog [Pieris rapae]|uniref:arrestin homolog n=1 Tax=Pieris rapae TaxID=64459 RepID=UPI001E27D93D|nr:arrestin homolog [Pieris rapae]